MDNPPIKQTLQKMNTITTTTAREWLVQLNCRMIPKPFESCLLVVAVEIGAPAAAREQPTSVHDGRGREPA